MPIVVAFAIRILLLVVWSVLCWKRFLLRLTVVHPISVSSVSVPPESREEIIAVLKKSGHSKRENTFENPNRCSTPTVHAFLKQGGGEDGPTRYYPSC